MGVDEGPPTFRKSPYDSLAILEFLDVDEEVTGLALKVSTKAINHGNSYHVRSVIS